MNKDRLIEIINCVGDFNEFEIIDELNELKEDCNITDEEADYIVTNTELVDVFHDVEDQKRSSETNVLSFYDDELKEEIYLGMVYYRIWGNTREIKLFQMEKDGSNFIEGEELDF